jgi:hypothetical protein
MLPQYVIMLGARTRWRTAAGKVGKFEERDYKMIERIVREKHGFESCTIVRAKGFFKGREEDMVQIVILEANYERIRACAQQLRRAFKQKTALVVSGGVGEFLS